MTSPHFDCITDAEYVRRVQVIADALDRTAAAMVADSPDAEPVAREWRAAAMFVRAAAGDDAEVEARLGVSTIEILTIQEAEASTRLDGETYTLD